MRLRPVVYVAVLTILVGAGTASAAKPPAPCGSDVYVNTLIRGTPTDPDPYAFVSDGNESYPNGGRGPNKIEGRFQVDNCTHDFTLNLNLSTRYTVALLSQLTITSKFFNFDRVASVPITPGPGNPDFGATGFCSEGIVQTADGKVRKNPDGSYQDNYAGCGMDPDGTWYVRRAAVIGFYEGQDRDYRLSFNRSPLDTWSSGACDNNPQVCEASHVRVYHPDASTWIIRQEEGGNGAALLKSGGNNSGYQFQNYEIVPFEMAVTRP